MFLKSPIETNHEAVAEQVRRTFSVEVGILQRLGSHPRIVRYVVYSYGNRYSCSLIGIPRYLGEQSNGVLLGEASHGNLQAYINASNLSIELFQRKEWCRQAAEAVAYIHSRGAIHSDLRPETSLCAKQPQDVWNIAL